MATPPKAVTFDFWNTLLQEDRAASKPRRIDAWLGILEGEGAALEREELQLAFDSGWAEFEDHWARNVIYRAEDWVRSTLGRLGLDPSPDIRTALVAAMTDPHPDHDPPLAPNIGACLEAISAAGVRIGIICDVGITPSRTLRRFLDGHGLLGYFDHWSFSDEVGVFKPDPVIFEHAMSGLGVDDPADLAHVGDLRRTDIAGANAMGITSVRYAGVFDDPGVDADAALVEADHVLTDHATLPAILGLT